MPHRPDLKRTRPIWHASRETAWQARTLSTSRPTRRRETLSGQSPRYLEIAEALRGEIEDGTHKIGAKLPIEHDLCTRFGASRFTIRQALARLREDGLIDARPGIGTLVLAARRRKTFVQTVNSVEELLQYPGETFRRHLSNARIKVSPEQALMLKCKTGQEWVKLTALRLTRSDQAPIAWVEAYIRPEFSAVIDQPNPSGNPLVRQIEEHFDHPPAHAQVEIFVGHVTPDWAEALMCAVDDPAMIILRRYRGSDGAVYLVTYSVHPENRFSLNFQFEKN